MIGYHLYLRYLWLDPIYIYVIYDWIPSISRYLWLIQSISTSSKIAPIYFYVIYDWIPYISTVIYDWIQYISTVIYYISTVSMIGSNLYLRYLWLDPIYIYVIYDWTHMPGGCLGPEVRIRKPEEIIFWRGIN